MSYSLENLKSIEFAPNVDFNMPNDMLTEEANEIKSSLVRTRTKDNEFYDGDDANN